MRDSKSHMQLGCPLWQLHLKYLTNLCMRHTGIMGWAMSACIGIQLSAIKLQQVSDNSIVACMCCQLIAVTDDVMCVQARHSVVERLMVVMVECY
eukprot:jgi/Chrzof1/7823/Cz02g37250.t1